MFTATPTRTVLTQSRSGVSISQSDDRQRILVDAPRERVQQSTTLEKYPSERYPSERHPSDRPSQDRYAQDRYPQDRYPQDRYPPDRSSSDRYNYDKYQEKSSLERTTERQSDNRYLPDRQPDRYPNDRQDRQGLDRHPTDRQPIHRQTLQQRQTSRDDSPSKTFPQGFKLPGVKRARTASQRFFENPISEAAEDHFKDFRELFGKALCDYLAKTCGKYTSVSMKLKVIGEDAETAYPSIVILCHPSVSKKVKQFFDQSHVKAQFQARNKAFQHELKLVICSQEPTLKAADSELLYMENGKSPEERGMLVKAHVGDRPNFAALGGLIKLEIEDQGVGLRALTVGHLFRLPEQSLEPKLLTYEPEFIDISYGDDEEVSDLAEEEDDDDEEEYDSEDDDDSSEALDMSVLHLRDSKPLEFSQSSLFSEPRTLSEDWTELGRLKETSILSTEGANLDWAMVEIDEPWSFSQRYLQAFSQEDSTLPTFIANKAIETALGKDVLVMSPYGFKKASLGNSFSYLMLEAGKDFTRTYDLRFQDGKGKNI
jgi:hypothetical protein